MKKTKYGLAGSILAMLLSLFAMPANAFDVLRINPMYQSGSFESYGYELALGERNSVVFNYTTANVNLLFLTVDSSIASISYKHMFSQNSNDGGYTRVGAMLWQDNTFGSSSTIYSPTFAVGYDAKLGEHVVMSFEMATDIGIIWLGYRF